MRVVRSADRIQMLDRGDVVSDLLRRPGPTHDLFDVLAACIAGLRPGPRVAVLGFAAGGLIAPLRAMGVRGPVDAVDASSRGYRIFRDVARSWAGTVRFREEDAAHWLARRRAPYDAILEDLSVPAAAGHVKPGASFLDLPRAIAACLAPGGLAIVNVLPPDDRDFHAALAAVCAPWPRAYTVSGEEWDNRIVIAGRSLPGGREIGRAVREQLSAIGSREASRLGVRRLR